MPRHGMSWSIFIAIIQQQPSKTDDLLKSMGKGSQKQAEVQQNDNNAGTVLRLFSYSAPICAIPSSKLGHSWAFGGKINE
jgi:hypothetical protein